MKWSIKWNIKIIIKSKVKISLKRIWLIKRKLPLHQTLVKTLRVTWVIKTLLDIDWENAYIDEFSASSRNNSFNGLCLRAK